MTEVINKDVQRKNQNVHLVEVSMLHRMEKGLPFDIDESNNLGQKSTKVTKRIN